MRFKEKLFSGLGYSLVALFVTTSCGNSSKHSDLQILGGEKTSAFPEVAFLRVDRGYCTGTYISPRVVLTAAHCLVGTHQVRINGTEIRSLRFKKHARYVQVDPTMVDNDIAVVEFNKYSPPPAFMALGTKPNVADATELVGFGISDPHVQTHGGLGVKRRGTNKVAMFEYGSICMEEYTEDPRQHSTILVGDSGGPLVSQGKLVGISISMLPTDVDQDSSGRATYVRAGVPIAVDIHNQTVKEFLLEAKAEGYDIPDVTFLRGEKVETRTNTDVYCNRSF